MDEDKKLIFIKKITPLLYDLALAFACIFVIMRARLWMNLAFSWETAILLGTVFTLYYVVDLLIVKGIWTRFNLVGEYFASIGTFIVMYLTMSFLIVDTIQGILHIWIKSSNTQSYIFIWFGFVCFYLVAFSTIYGFLKTRYVRLKKYVLPVENLESEQKVVLVSDLHVGYFVGPKHMKKMVKRINSVDADLVLIAGDIINAQHTEECKNLGKVAEILSTIKAKRGVYFVTGNHDPTSKDKAFMEFLKASNISLIDEEIQRDEVFDIVGRRTKTRERESLSELISQKGGVTKPVIVLDHDPMGQEEAMENGADLVLSGHTHKGQVFPLNLLLRFLYQKEEIYGCYRRGKTSTVVSSGAGYFSMPMRIMSSCEVVELDLH